MAIYEYTARNEAGELFSGIYEDVGSISTMKVDLAKVGCSLINAKKKRTISAASIRLKQADVIAFAYKFAGMCSAGLTIVQCLDSLEKQTDKEALKFIIGDIRKDIEAGSSLTDAFHKHHTIFSDFFLGMIEAGETGGKLAESLEISARYLEKQADLRTRIKNAFTYPMVVLVMCLAIITALVIFVVPVFSKIYGQLGVSLPGPTQLLVISSVIMRKWWPLLIVIGFTAPFICRYLQRNKYLKNRWDYFKFNIPVFGKLYNMVVVSQFIRSFAMLIMTGVPIIRAFQIATLVANNEKIAEISLDVQKSVQTGNGVAESFEKHDIFPPIIVQLAGSGEQAGVLGQMLNKGADFLEKDIERMTNSMLVKLEPILTIGMGAVIGLILMAVYLPMFDYMSHLK